MEVFFAYRDAPERRAALQQPSGALERYRLFGLDQLVAEGVGVRHNLERVGRPPAWGRAVDRAINAVLYRAGGYGGDFASILASLRVLNRSEAVFSTVDTVGIPLILLKRFGLVRPPLVYTAVGLPERLEQLRGPRMRRFFRQALGTGHTIVSYAESEVARIRQWLGPQGPHVVFVPFGVDTDAFRPSGQEPREDVVSIGADPRRDFSLLATIAERRPDVSIRIVASAERARALGSLPTNVSVETDIPLERVRDRLAAARVVALPVTDNTYSGATTVLLQAMAMAKPVVVSRTEAIATGYGLEDGVNCRLVSPGDAEEFEHAIADLLADPSSAAAMGARARETVERDLSWERYTDTLMQIISSA